MYSIVTVGVSIKGHFDSLLTRPACIFIDVAIWGTRSFRGWKCGRPPHAGSIPWREVLGTRLGRSAIPRTQDSPGSSLVRARARGSRTDWAPPANVYAKRSDSHVGNRRQLLIRSFVNNAAPNVNSCTLKCSQVNQELMVNLLKQQMVYLLTQTQHIRAVVDREGRDLAYAEEDAEDRIRKCRPV